MDGRSSEVAFVRYLNSRSSKVRNLRICSLTACRNKMLDFAARNKIYTVAEKFPMTLQGVSAAVDKLRSGKMRYRGVLSWD